MLENIHSGKFYAYRIPSKYPHLKNKIENYEKRRYLRLLVHFEYFYCNEKIIIQAKDVCKIEITIIQAEDPC